jgi:hypothetical protein
MNNISFRVIFRPDHDTVRRNLLMRLCHLDLNAVKLAILSQDNGHPIPQGGECAGKT